MTAQTPTTIRVQTWPPLFVGLPNMPQEAVGLWPFVDRHPVGVGFLLLSPRVSDSSRFLSRRLSDGFRRSGEAGGEEGAGNSGSEGWRPHGHHPAGGRERSRALLRTYVLQRQDRHGKGSEREKRRGI